MIRISVYRDNKNHQKIYTITISDAFWANIPPKIATTLGESTEVKNNRIASVLNYLLEVVLMEKEINFETNDQPKRKAQKGS